MGTVIESTVSERVTMLDDELRAKIVDQVRERGDVLALVGQSRSQWEMIILLCPVNAWGVESWVVLEESQSELHAEMFATQMDALGAANLWCRLAEEGWDEGVDGWDFLENLVQP